MVRDGEEVWCTTYLGADGTRTGGGEVGFVTGDQQESHSEKSWSSHY